jgi:peptide/nickel transport system substrate-binding protein
VHLDPGLNGSDDVAAHIGNSVQERCGDREAPAQQGFPAALSLGIDRDQLNEAFWLGVGSSARRPAPDTIFSPVPNGTGNGARSISSRPTTCSTSWGSRRRDGEGYRLRADGKGRVRLEMITVGGSFVPFTPVAEMIKQQWRKIGVDVDIKELERNLAFTRDNNNENQIITWANDGSEVLFLFPRHALPVDAAESHMGMAFAKWYASKGASGKKPDDPEMLRAFDLFRSTFGMKEEDRIKTAKEIWKIIVEQTWSIGTVGQSPCLHGRSHRQEQHGATYRSGSVNAQHVRTPALVVAGDVLLQVRRNAAAD